MKTSFWKFARLLQILAPLPIGFAVFLVHLATIPITGTGINPARSLGAAIIYNTDAAWDDHVSKPCFHSNWLEHHHYLTKKKEHFFLVSCLRAKTNKFMSFCWLSTVGLLGWTYDWSCSCCSLSSDNHQSYAIPQVFLSFLVSTNGFSRLKECTFFFLVKFLVLSLWCICNVDFPSVKMCSIMCVNYQVMIM